jgi:hypothetical protein
MEGERGNRVSVSALSAGAYTATFYVMVIGWKGTGVQYTSHFHQPGLIFPSWWDVRQKSAITTLCTIRLWYVQSTVHPSLHINKLSPPPSTVGQLITHSPILIVMVTFWDALASTSLYGISQRDYCREVAPADWLLKWVNGDSKEYKWKGIVGIVVPVQEIFFLP